MEVCAPELSVGDEEEDGWSVNIRDPRNTSYAWDMRFRRTGRAMQLVRISYFFDECDAP
jgi:hypothetical protein